MSKFQNILVTTDFSEPSLAGVDEAASLARRLGGHLHLIFVVEDHLPPILPFTTDQDRQKVLAHRAEVAEEHLAKLAEEHLNGCDYQVHTAVGPAAQKIVETAKSLDADLIVMACRGYGPMAQILIGSTAERVLHHAPCRVLIVPSQ